MMRKPMLYLAAAGLLAGTAGSAAGPSAGSTVRIAGDVRQPFELAGPSMKAGAISCEDLTAVRAPDLRIVRATPVTPDPHWSIPHPRPQDPVAAIDVPFCRVEAVVEGEINFELWLPQPAAWNGRMLGTGNGGFAGFLRYDGLAHGVERGFATISTDTGHRAEEKHWSIGHPRRLENYGHRGQHLSAVNARTLIDAYYGTPARYAYFMGCSGGGMQAINEVQRYPADYDGVIAGAHGYSIAGISARWLESALIGKASPGTPLTPADWRKIAVAGVAQCDADDGVEDGIIGNPRTCKFSLADTPGLSADKIATAQQVLGPLMGKEGRVLFEGFLPGAEFTVSEPNGPGEFFGDWLYRDPSWDFTMFDASRDVPMAENAVPGSVFTNPDIGAFARRGGKLISYQGWADGIVPGEATIAYYTGVRDHMGVEATDAFYRLYMAPGMDHCSGGAGADHFGQSFLGHSPEPATAQNDILLAIMRWVEEGVAPGVLRAVKVSDDKVAFSRPLCPYPTHSVYTGKGSAEDAGSFRCESS